MEIRHWRFLWRMEFMDLLQVFLKIGSHYLSFIGVNGTHAYY